MGRGAEALLAGGILLCAAVAHAQDPREEASPEQLFQDGAAALEEGRFPDAARLFAEVLARRPHLGAAFNLAVALRGQGRMTRARDVLEDLLGGRYGPLAEDQRGEVLAIRRDVTASIAHASVVVVGGPRARILLDGEEIGESDGRPLRLAVDPGAHVVAAVAADGRSARRRWEATSGSGPSLRLVLAPRAPVRETGREDRGPGHWPWILGIGIPIVVVIATAVVVLVAVPDEQADFLGDPVEVP